LIRRLKETKDITLGELNSTARILDPSGSYRVVYKDPREYRRLAARFKLMNDIRSGMPRTAYCGVVEFSVPNGARIYAVHPNLNLDGIDNPNSHQISSQIYDPQWDLMSKYLDFAEIYCKKNRWTGNCDPKKPRHGKMVREETAAQAIICVGGDDSVLENSSNHIQYELHLSSALLLGLCLILFL